MRKRGDNRFWGKFFSITGGTLDNATVTVTLYQADNVTPIVSAAPASFFAHGRYYLDHDCQADGDWIADFQTSDVNAEFASDSCWLYISNDLYALTHTEEGDPVSIVIPPPVGAYQCRVFALCYDQASQEPLDLLTAKFKITQPYYYEGKYHDIQEYNGILSEPDENGSRFVYCDVVWGCKLQVTLSEVGIVKRGTVPALSSLDVYALQ